MRKSLANVSHVVCQVGGLTRLSSWRWRDMKLKEDTWSPSQAVKRKIAETQFQKAEWVLQFRRSSRAEQTNGRPQDCRLQGRIHHHMENHPWAVWQRQGNKRQCHKRDGTPPVSEKDLLSEWREYFSSLLNNSNSQSSSALPPPTAQDLTNSPTREETLLAIRQMKTNKTAGLDSAITAEKPPRMVAMQWLTLSMASEQKYTSTSLTPPNQWTTSVIVLYLRRETLVRWPTTVEYPSCQSVRRCTRRSYWTEPETTWIRS